MITRTIFIAAAFVVVFPLIAVAQTVLDGYFPLADDVYAFTAEGGDDGFVVGCELGNDVRVYVSNNYIDIEEYSAIEQLKLLGCNDTPSLVTAGFSVGGNPTALLLGISNDPESWPTFHQLIFGKDKISLSSYPTSLIAGVFDEPGAWAELCPFFSRQETLNGFSGLYQTSYLFSRPDGTFAGFIWRDNGIWLVTFADTKVVVDRVYAPATGNYLAPVWNVSCSRAGKVASIVSEMLSNKGETSSEESVSVFEASELETITPDPAQSEFERSDDSLGATEDDTDSTIEESANTQNEEDESEELIEPESEEGAVLPNESNSSVNQEEDAQESDTSMDETATAPPIVTAPVQTPATVESESKLVLVSNYNGKTWAIDVAELKQPHTLSLGLAVDGRPFAFWTYVNKDKAKTVQYWGLKHADPTKIVPFEIMPSDKSAPPHAAMRTLGLPALVYEESGKVMIRLNNGSSSEWITQEAYTLTGRLMGLDAVMGLKTTAYFILDGDKLVWHWHKSK